jgi:3-oxo-5-alpha-steroid 4-dehydrogenase 1
MEQLYKYTIIFLFASGLLTWISLYFVTAGYGRFGSKKWGPAVNPKLGWLLMESPVVVLPIVFVCLGKVNAVTGVMLGIWLSHYVQRDLIYPFLIKNGAKMPCSIILMSLFFNLMNGFINGYWLFFLSDYQPEWFGAPQFILGVILFYFGMFVNIQSDKILRDLRKEKGPGYHIPEKGFHRFVASPNYFGEIVEWAGWALLTWSMPGLTFLFFTMANLVPRAHSNRKWYIEKFGEAYPKSRKRVFPFIY